MAVMQAMEKFKQEIERCKKNGTLQRNLKVVIIGETGSGKSTFVNYLLSFFDGGSYEKPTIAIPMVGYPATADYEYNERNQDDSTLSKTGSCRLYSVSFGNSERAEVEKNLFDVQFNFVDTPGFNDTAGSKMDQKHYDNILSYLRGLEYFNAVIIVQNGTVGRLTEGMQRTVHRIRDMLPPSVRNNLILVLTNCKKMGRNFEPKVLLPLQFPDKNVFHMDNCAFSGGSHSAREKGSKDFKKAQIKWNKSMNKIAKIMIRLLEFEPMNADIFAALMKRKATITSEIAEKKAKLENALRAYNAFQGPASDGSRVDYDQVIDWDVVEDTPYYSTLCSNHARDELCHDDCGLPWNNSEDRWQFEECVCMLAVQKEASNQLQQQQRKCVVCGCGFATHYHVKHRTVTIKQKLGDFLQSQWSVSSNLPTGKIGMELCFTNIKGTFNDLKQLCLTFLEVCSEYDLKREFSKIVKWAQSKQDTQDAQLYQVLQAKIAELISYLNDKDI